VSKHGLKRRSRNRHPPRHVSAGATCRVCDAVGRRADRLPRHLSRSPERIWQHCPKKMWRIVQQRTVARTTLANHQTRQGGWQAKINHKKKQAIWEWLNFCCISTYYKKNVITDSAKNTNSTNQPYVVK
jgi:hypothetical protein